VTVNGGEGRGDWFMRLVATSRRRKGKISRSAPLMVGLSPVPSPPLPFRRAPLGRFSVPHRHSVVFHAFAHDRRQIHSAPAILRRPHPYRECPLTPSVSSSGSSGNGPLLECPANRLDLVDPDPALAFLFVMSLPRPNTVPVRLEFRRPSTKL